ncbi:MAG: hypothetical protein AAGK78_10455, partial [Planctomycetota bacterium]
MSDLPQQPRPTRDRWLFTLIAVAAVWLVTAIIVGLGYTGVAYATNQLSAGRIVFQVSSTMTLTGFAVSWSDVADLTTTHRVTLMLGTAVATLCFWIIGLAAIRGVASVPMPRGVLRSVIVLASVHVAIVVSASVYHWLVVGMTVESSLFHAICGVGGSGMRWQGEPATDWLW